jgi:hypothetical protein
MGGDLTERGRGVYKIELVENRLLQRLCECLCFERRNHGFLSQVTT